MSRSARRRGSEPSPLDVRLPAGVQSAARRDPRPARRPLPPHPRRRSPRPARRDDPRHRHHPQQGVEIIIARQLSRSLRAGSSAAAIWARHPARWDPHGRFPLPGLTSLLAELQSQHPTLSIEANRVVAANPTRSKNVASAALVTADRHGGTSHDSVDSGSPSRGPRCADFRRPSSSW
jgi:hypothetical protein